MKHFRSRYTLAFGPALLFFGAPSFAADSDQLVADGEYVEAQDRVIDTTGNSVHSAVVWAGGHLQLHNFSGSTMGSSANGIRVEHPGSTLVSTGALNIVTQGAASHGIMLDRSARATLAQVDITTHGNNSSGLYLRTSQAHLAGGTILTQGNQSDGLHAQQFSQLSASGMLVVTQGTRSHGVSALNSDVSLNQTDVLALGRDASAVSLNRGNLNVQGGSLQSHWGPALLMGGVGNRAMIDGTFVASAEGAVFGLAENAQANVHVSRSTLSAAGGNGDIVDLGRGAQLDLVIEDSVINGHLKVEQGSDVNVSLLNGSRLTGQVSGVGELGLGTGSHWQLTGNSEVSHLLMGGGLVSFGDGDYQRLTLGELSGEGVFNLRVDADQRLSDLVEVTGKAEGNYQVIVQSSGVERASGSDALEVIRTGGGDAQFAMVNGGVDLGAFSYGLARDGDSWYVSDQASGISASTRTVQALFNTAPSIWYGELSTLRSRMGEVRGTGQAGAWMRSYGNKYNVDTGGGLSYRQQQLGFSLGVDTLVPAADSQWLAGVLAGYSHSDLSLARGSSGQVESYYVGAYGTWLADSGWYADAMLKLNQFQNQAEVSMSDGGRAAGRYTSHGLGTSVELGKHIKLGEELYVEPFTQWSGLLVGGKRFGLDNGIKAKNANTGSLLGKAGATLGRTHELAGGGIVQPYVKAAVAHEFVSGNQVKVNGHRFKNDLSGTRGELGAGLAVAMSSNLQLHGHVDYMGGEQIEQPWGVNVGLRYAFD